MTFGDDEYSSDDVYGQVTSWLQKTILMLDQKSKLKSTNEKDTVYLQRREETSMYSTSSV